MAKRKKIPAIEPGGVLAPATLRMPEPPTPPLPDAVDVDIVGDGDIDAVSIDPITGAAIIEADDGGVIIDFSPPAKRDKTGAARHDANLAEYIDDSELQRIASELLEGIQQDDQSRTDWLEQRAQGIRLLGLKIEQPKASVDSSTAVEGQSTVRHPLLLEAVLRFQANARGELLPSDGPVKVEDRLGSTGKTDQMAESLEEDLNYYLTSVATEYYPDTDRLLFAVGFSGCGFKKVYYCPIRMRPVSESVDAKDIIVSDAATDLRNSRRFTHQIYMKPSTLRRMQLAGAYRDIPLVTPNPVQLNPVDLQVASTQGIDPNTSMQENDRDYTIYECYCELNIRGFEDRDRKGETGLHLPYRVTLDKDSRQILEIRRNWKEGDETKMAKVSFVKYAFVPALGFYDVGLLSILGNTTNALTAAWRELLDAGMFGNFPGFIYAKLAGRQNTNEFRVPPGGGIGFETNGQQSIRDAIMPLPYKDISTAFAAFIENISQTGQRLGGTAEINIGEGKQDAPVGTTLALIEQATKVEDAVHKRLHAAQAEEFQLLKECFRENPESFVRCLKGKGSPVDWSEEQFLAALDDASIVPQADPNTPTHMHRLMKAMALKQLQGLSPQLYNGRAVDTRILDMLGFSNADEFFNPPTAAQPQINPEAMAKMAELAMKGKQLAQDAQKDQMDMALKLKGLQQKDQSEQRDLQIKQTMQARESADQEADRVSRERIAAMGLVSDLINHPAEQDIAADAAHEFGALPQ